MNLFIIENCKNKLDAPEGREEWSAGMKEAVGWGRARDTFERAGLNQAAKTASRKASNSSLGV